MKVTKAAGLFTSDNPYTAASAETFAQADNCVIRNKDVIECRRGHENLGYLTSGPGPVDEVFFYGTTPIAFVATGSPGAYSVQNDTGSSFVANGTTAAPDYLTLRIKAVEANQNLYYTTVTGLQLLTNATALITGNRITAGAAPTLDPIGASIVSGLRGNPNASDAWLASNTAVAYRGTLLYIDANNNQTESAATGRFVVANPADASVNAGGLVRATNVVTATTTAAHGFNVGDTFILDAAEVGPPAFGAGPFTVTAVPTSTSFKYAETAADGVSANAHTIKSGLKTTSLKLFLTSLTTFTLSATTTDFYIRLYRTATSPTASVDPGDEEYLVYERRITATDISNGYVTINDTTPEAFLGDPLYINEVTGDGIASSNDLPPYSKDLALWNNRLWLGNTYGPQRYDLRILGTGSPNGIQNNDLLVVQGKIYEFVNTSLGGSASSDYRTVEHYEQYSAPKNVQKTTASLAGVVAANYSYSLQTVRALQTSSPDDAPGDLTFDTLTVTSTPFYVAASRSASFSPVVPTASKVQNTSARVSSTVTVNTATNHGFSVGQTIYLASNSPLSAFPVGTKTVVSTPSNTQFTYTEAGTATTFDTSYVVHAITAVSSNDVRPNGLFYSKPQQLEAFPALNYLTVGAKNSNILRIIPLRDKLYVFKEDGLFTVAGSSDFRVDLLDNTVKLVAPDSIAIVANRIYALTSQGIVQITEGGAGIISGPIKNDIIPLLTSATAGFKRACFGVGYETEHQYMLWLPSSASGTTCTRAFVYNVFDQTWTKRTDSRRCGRVSPSDFLYLGSTDLQTLSKERKAFDATDFTDESFAVTVTSGTTTTATLSSVSGITVGDYFIQGTVKGPITAINSLTVTFTADGAGAASGGAATVYKGIQCTLVWNPQTGGDPGITKHFTQLTLHFGQSDFELGAITTVTDLNYTSPTSDTITTGSALAAVPKNLRKHIPLQSQRCAFIQPGFSIREGRAGWRLFGYSLQGDATSERTSR